MALPLFKKLSLKDKAKVPMGNLHRASDSTFEEVE
jgi:hypothetical protein